MREGIAIVAFTSRGAELGSLLAEELEASLAHPGQEGFSLTSWTAEQFPKRSALIFIGAAGIAVRAVAPYIKSKAEDPAVVCLDELGQYAIPLLSGHLGGANTLAGELAAMTGGTAVITTATDVNGLFAVDLWAKRQHMAVLQPERIKNVSAKILRGETVRVDSPWPVTGKKPELVETGMPEDMHVSCYREDRAALQLVPRIVTLGVGCRRGTTREQLEVAFARFCGERGLLPQAIRAAASIDLKAAEEGLKAFCAAHAWPLRFYTAEELKAVPGVFSASAFVEQTTGVDNVCERAAVLDSGGELIEKKHAAEGVTFAAAAGPFAPDWSW